MTHTHMQSHNGLSIGDEVIHIKEDGFNAGQRQNKQIAKIILTEFTSEESRRLRVPTMERHVVFTDGSIAGHYDKVIKR